MTSWLSWVYKPIHQGEESATSFSTFSLHLPTICLSDLQDQHRLLQLCATHHPGPPRNLIGNTSECSSSIPAKCTIINTTASSQSIPTAAAAEAAEEEEVT
jgi:hypothetical protein